MISLASLALLSALAAQEERPYLSSWVVVRPGDAAPAAAGSVSQPSRPAAHGLNRMAAVVPSPDATRAAVVAVADVVEAMASHRPYRASLGIEEALTEIEKNRGILYDEVVVDACLKLFREKNYQFI